MEGIELVSMVEEVGGTSDVVGVGLISQPSSVASGEVPFLSDEVRDKQPSNLISEQVGLLLSTDFSIK